MLPVQTNVGEVLFPDERLDDGEVGGELRHHHDLVPGVLLADPQHLLDDSVDLRAGAFHDDIRQDILGLSAGISSNVITFFLVLDLASLEEVFLLTLSIFYLHRRR